MSKIFGKKKKSVTARCPITKESIENGFGYLLTTSQVVVSQKYWDMVMTEPETMSYTVSHFRNQESGTRMRTLIFEKYSGVDKPWIISDSCVSLFDSLNKTEARELAQRWWKEDGGFSPDNCGSALEGLTPEEYQKWKDYAVLEAGRSRVSMHRATA